MENKNVSLPSAMNRARAMFPVLSPLVQLFLALFFYLCISLSFLYIYPLTFASFSVSPQFLALLLFPASTNLYTTLSACFSRINRQPNVHTHARMYVRINDERNGIVIYLIGRFVYTRRDVHVLGRNDFPCLHRVYHFSRIYIISFSGVGKR